MSSRDHSFPVLASDSNASSRLLRLGLGVWGRPDKVAMQRSWITSRDTYAQYRRRENRCNGISKKKHWWVEHGGSMKSAECLSEAVIWKEL